jgi:nitrogen-specific signal transduction histidine kinase
MRMFTIRDVTDRERMAAERREVEHQLRHAQKMDAVGRLAGGIGHDLGNVLAVVLSYVEDLVQRTGGRERSDLEVVMGAAERAANLVRQMMTLSRKGGAASPTVLSVNAVVNDLAKLLRRSLGERVTLATELAGDAWPAFVDGAQLGQVLLNLVVNARDAMPAGGRVVVRTENLVFEERQGGLVEGRPGQYVALVVSDSGVGMTPEVRERIFEPFFTTKEQGKGTGLGLAVTYGIVRQAGGTIHVESQPGAGTTFRILLPRAREERVEPRSPSAAAAVPQEARAAPVGAGRTALVVDDEPSLRELVARVLAQDGFHVLQGACADEAMAAARTPGTRVDLLLTDVVMPGAYGTELADAVVAQHPACKVLLMTGFPSAPQVLERVRRGGLVLQKPFRRSALVERVREVLAA